MVDNNVMAQLYAPFDLKVRQGVGNQKFKYVPSTDVIDRMNKVFMGKWNTIVLGTDIIEDFVLVRVQVSAIVEDREYQHAGFGSAPIARYNSGQKAGKIIDVGNSYKSALSTAIRNACTKFGVGLYLEGEHWDDTEGTSETVGQYKESGDMPQTIVPSMTAPKTTQVPPLSLSSTKIPPLPKQAPVEQPAPVEEAKAEPVIPEVQLENKPAPKPAFPKIPSPTATSGMSAPKVPPSMTAGSGGSVGRITDVQMAALDALLNLRDVKYEDLAKEAFEANGLSTDNIPAKENLDYKQAVSVISYGNHLYRKP